jgi:Fic family protein
VDTASFRSSSPGELVPIAGLQGADWAFVPASLPPAWTWPVELWPRLLEARVALAALSGIGASLPDPQIILRPLFQREAARSSSLEGTYTPPRQQALFELDPSALDVTERRSDDYREIANYRQALQAYFENPDALPMSLRLMRELHAVLLDSVRGADKDPGHFRRVQVHIGRPPHFVPPPPDRLMECLVALESYLHAPSPYDPLVDAFLVHYQFEAIHPFRDGNGRVGRLLLSIMITERCGLSAPWLHMSAFFDAHRDEYLERLLRVSTHGAWTGWIDFCLRGALLQAQDTTERCRRLLALRRETLDRIAHIKGSNRLAPLVDRLFSSPVVTIPWVAKQFDVAYGTARADVEKLVGIGLLAEAPEQSQPKAYYAPGVLDVIAE